MNFLAWLIMATGGYLAWSGVSNHDPKKTLVSLLQTGTVPAAKWYAPPVPFTGGTTLGEIAGIGLGAATQSAQGDQAGFNAGTAVGAALANAGAARQAIVSFAYAQLGEPYVWGAAGPNSWDCSGLTMEAYKTVGVKLPHHAASQQTLGKATATPQVGDLIFWGPVSGHVAIYLGDDKMIHAPHTGDVVKISNISDPKHARFRTYLS